MVEWKIMRGDFVEVIGEPFVKSIENQFEKKNLELKPNQLIPLLYKQKKLTEEEYELLKECYEGYSEEEQALTIQNPIPNTLVDDEEFSGTLDLEIQVEEAIKESSAEIDLFAGFEEDDVEEEIQKPSTRLQRFKFDETRYQKLGPIGKGGMGIVEKYLDLKLNKEVAVKKIYSKKVTKEQERRFQREKDMTALFDDPKIIRALDVGYDDNNNLCFVMEYVRGQEFSKRIERAGKGKSNSLPELLDILSKSLDALGGVHKKKVVHRDIKPDNIMIDEFNIKIMDFGLAKKIKDKELKREDVIEDLEIDAINTTGAFQTQAGVIMGTPAYMSPEQTEDSASVDHRADLYAIGAILYHILTGRPPHVGKTIMNTIYKVRKEPVIPPSKIKKKNFEIPAELESICLKALQKKPKQRYQTAEEFAEDIRAYLNGEEVKAHKYSSWKKMQRFIQKHPTGTLGTLLGTIILAGGGIGLQTLHSANLQAETEKARAESAEKEKELEEERANKAEKEKEIQKIRAENAEKEKALEKARSELLEVRAKAAETEVKGQSQSLATLDSIKFINQDQGYYQAALGIINRAISESEQFWKPYLIRAKHYAEFGHHEEAEQDFTRAQELFREQHKKESVEIWFEAGMHYGLPETLGGRGLEDRALEYFEKASTAGPTTPFGRLSRAVSLIIRSRQEPDNAEETLPEAIEITEELTIDDIAKNIDATWLVRAWALGASVFAKYNMPSFAEHADLEEAKKALLHVLKKDKDNISIRNFLATILVSLGKYDDAIQIYSKLLRIIKNPEIYGNRGVAYVKKGNLEVALEDFNSALRLNPDFPDILINIGTIYKKQGKLKQAEEQYTMAIRSDSLSTIASIIAYMERGIVREMQGNLEQAKQDYKKIINTAPKHALAHYRYGSICFQQRSLEEAAQYFDISISLDSRQVLPYCDRALIFGIKGDWEKAVQYYDRAISNDSKSGIAYNGRSNAYMNLGRLDEAEKDIRTSMRLGYDLAFVTFGEILMKKGDYERARQAFQEAYKKAPQYRSLIDRNMQELERRIKEK